MLREERKQRKIEIEEKLKVLEDKKSAESSK